MPVDLRPSKQVLSKKASARAVQWAMCTKAWAMSLDRQLTSSVT
jgi:hypothetical protein